MMIEHPLLMLKIQGSNPDLSKKPTFLPRSARGSQKSRVHLRTSESSEGGRVKANNPQLDLNIIAYFKSSLSLPTSTSLIQKTSDFFSGHTHLLCSNPFLPDKRLSSSFMVEDPHLGTRLKTTTLEWAEVRLALLGTTPPPSKKVCFSDK